MRSVPARPRSAPRSRGKHRDVPGHSDRELGALVLRTLRAEGVDTDYAVTDDTGRPTGLLLTEPRMGTLTRVSYSRSGSAGSAVTPADVLPTPRVFGHEHGRHV